MRKENRWNPLNNNRFIVSFGDKGDKKIGFSKISGVELTDPNLNIQIISKLGIKEMEHTIFNGYTDEDITRSFYGMQPEPQYHTVTLEKALLSYSDPDPKNKQKNKEEELLLRFLQENVLIEKIKVEILDNYGLVSATLTFKNCILESFKTSDLAASESGYINQSLTFRYYCVKLDVE